MTTATPSYDYVSTLGYDSTMLTYIAVQGTTTPMSTGRQLSTYALDLGLQSIIVSKKTAKTRTDLRGYTEKVCL